MSGRAVAMLVGVAVVALASAGQAQLRYSGRIVSVELDARRLVIEELGPSASEAPAAVQHAVTVTADTRVQLIGRARGIGPGGWDGEYTARSVRPGDIRRGDFATVVSSPSGEAEEIVIVRGGLE